jgi:hypothetical protein
MSWTGELITMLRHSPDLRTTLLPSAAAAFRRIESEGVEDPFREGQALAEFAELFIPPRLDGR